MSGEMEKNPSAWTTDTAKQSTDEAIAALEKYLVQRLMDLEKLMSRQFTDNDKALRAALMSQEKAIAAALQAVKEDNDKKALATEKRFDSVNEFRRTLSDQTNTFLPRPEYDANHKALEDKIDTKYTALDEKIQGLTDRMNINTGKSTGLTAGWGYLVGAIGLAAAVTGIILGFNN